MKKLKYFPILISLVEFLKNWYDIPFLILGIKKLVYLRNNLTFKIYDYLNMLQLVEIFYKNDYKVDLFKPKVIIDIGANIGDSTLYFAQKFPRAKILAFEPDRKIYMIMRQNIKLNNVLNILPFNLGVAGKNGSLKFYSYEFSGLSGFSKIDRVAKKSVIKTITLKKIFSDNKISMCDLIKMDCEGAEYEILLKSDKKLLKLVNKYVIEYHDGLNKHTHQELLDLFNNLDYRVKISPHKIEKNIGIIRAFKK